MKETIFTAITLLLAIAMQAQGLRAGMAVLGQQRLLVCQVERGYIKRILTAAAIYHFFKKLF